MKRKIKITSKNIKKTLLYTLLVLLVGLFIYVIVVSFDNKHVLSNATNPDDVLPSGEYQKYLTSHNYSLDNCPSDKKIRVSGTDATLSSDNDGFGPINVTDKDGSVVNALLTTAQGTVTYSFDVEEEGFYNILLEYYPIVYEISNDAGGANIERKVYVNGVLPYEDLRNVAFQRVWGEDENSEKIVDISGNEIKPVQSELPEIRSEYVKDQVGYVTEPFLVYCNQGINTISFESIREPMAIVNVYLTSKESYQSYEEVKATYSINGYEKVENGVMEFIEGEDSSKRSSSTLYAVSDRTSAYNSPADHVKILLNAIGGSKWSGPGDWISWDFQVDTTGLYNISMRAKQNTNRGLFSTRKLYINGEIPFSEAQNCKFNYSSDWQIVTLGTEEEAFYFYFEAGKKYTMTLESTLGDYGSQINRIQNVIDDLNDMYRKIIKITGISPDSYIDYKLTTNIPELISVFRNSAAEIRSVAKAISEISGEKSGETASLETMALQLEKFVKKPRNIQKNLSSFSTNISSLGTWIITVSQQSLLIDYLMIHADDYKLPKANPNFFLGLWWDICSFFKSFFFDYESIGTTEGSLNANSIEVWLLTSASAGREQGNSIRTVIDSSFNKYLAAKGLSDINVNLKVVAPGVLLTATLAGRGPDVAINLDGGTPVNYALRGAAYDLTAFDDFKYEVLTDNYGNRSYKVYVDGETESRFQASAMTPYEFADGEIVETSSKDIYGNVSSTGFYALPNTQGFLVMFYRTDIFEDHNWEIPETWTDVINLIPELQIENLQFYLPLNTVGASSVVNQIFASRLYQTGGRFYRETMNPDGEYYIESNFDSDEAMSAFQFWCDFYTSYSFSLSISASTFINRFRTGEMPIGIASYETYNTLAVSAPEIRGKWKFALMPGTEQVNGTIDRSGAASGTAIMMMAQAKNPEGGWNFMKWWTSEDTQVEYAREIEAILGAAARHPTANIKAFERLAWTVEELNILTTQWNVTVGVPEVAGGYYTGRNLENAFRYVVNNNVNPRDTLEDYILIINSEITRKRKEFGLPIAPVA